MKLNIQSYGDGDTQVAILHGASASQLLFKDLIERLVAHNCAVLGVDLRGHGLSPRGDTYMLSDYVGDVVESLPSDLDVIAGHSLGTLILLEAVGQLLPKRAIYLDPPWFFFPGVDATILRAQISDGDMHAGVGEHPDGTPFTLDELASVNPGWGSENIARASASHDQWDPAMLSPMTDIVMTPRNVAATAPAVPSLVVYGGSSPMCAVAPIDDLRNAGYEVRIQAGAGHNLHLDDPDATMACLEDWL
jgi:pimeloyl-ACP methyl ester carboxylesterase